MLSVFAADIDGDGRNGSENCEHQCDGARSVFAADIDGDGRMDLASAQIGTTRLHGIAM